MSDSSDEISSNQILILSAFPITTVASKETDPGSNATATLSLLIFTSKVADIHAAVDCCTEEVNEASKSALAINASKPILLTTAATCRILFSVELVKVGLVLAPLLSVVRFSMVLEIGASVLLVTSSAMSVNLFNGVPLLSVVLLCAPVASAMVRISMAIATREVPPPFHI
jgi:hypothetical protein